MLFYSFYIRLTSSVCEYSCKKCQVCHWSYHKQSCQDINTKGSERNASPISVSSVRFSNSLHYKSSFEVDNSGLNQLYNKEDISEECANYYSHVSGNCCVNEGEWEKGGRKKIDSDKLSNAMQQICLPCSQESNETEKVTEKETVSIVIRHNKVKHELTVSKSDNGNSLLQVISDSVSIPISKLKLIHKGKIATSENIKEMLFNRALFLACGEVSESEEGLEKTDIDLIVEQLDVDRNLAIRTLRKTGSVLDAIIEIGNM